MTLYSTSVTGNLHVRLADHADTHIEANLLPQSGEVYLGIALPISLPNVLTLGLTRAQAKELAGALSAALSATLTP